MLLIPQPTLHYLFLLVNTVFNPESKGGGRGQLDLWGSKDFKNFYNFKQIFIKI